jgi:hypothetical protein
MSSVGPGPSDDPDLAAARESFSGAQADLPKRRAQADVAEKGIEETEAELGKLREDRIKALQDQQKQTDAWGDASPQDHINYVMQQSPLFLAMAALAGGFQRSSSITALGSMNGMVQGILKGDRQQFEDAQTKYQQQYESMKEKWATRDKIFNELEKAYGDSAEGMQRRWQIANAAIGEDEKTSEQSLKYMGELRKLEQQQQEKQQEWQERVRHDKAEEAHMRAEEDIQREKVDKGNKKEAAANAAKADLVGKIDDSIDTLIGQISSAPSPTTGVAGTVNRAWQWAKGKAGQPEDVTPTIVRSNLEQLQVLMAQYDKAGGRPSNQMITMMGSIVGGTDPLADKANTLARLRQLKQMVGVEKQSIGSEGMGPAAPAVTYKSAAEVKQAYQSGAITRDEASKILRDNGWAH